MKITKTYFQQKFLEIALKPIFEAQKSGGFKAIITGLIPSPEWETGTRKEKTR